MTDETKDVVELLVLRHMSATTTVEQSQDITRDIIAMIE